MSPRYMGFAIVIRLPMQVAASALFQGQVVKQLTQLITSLER